MKGKSISLSRTRTVVANELRPLLRHIGIRRKPRAASVQHRDVASRKHVPAFGRFEPPLRGLGVVLLHSLSVGVHHSYRRLGWNVALLGGLQRVFERQG